MTPPQITDAEALETHLASSRFLLFKHSPICPVSARAFAAFEAFAAANPDVETGWIDVIGGRELSLRVARATGVSHESPQAILLESGRAVWNASHGAIDGASLSTAIGPGRT